MCGIAGIFSKELSSPLLRKYTEAMLSEIAHRGPDDEGIVMFSENESICYTTGNSAPQLNDNPKIPYLNVSRERILEGSFLALGHRRLSIIDKSIQGHQPMCTGDEQYWISYNGEVYNYQKLKHQLEADGMHFYSETDSEVVLNSYKKWGKACLSKLNGMFSFVIYDRKTQTIFAARDPFGVKPFYFYKTEKAFVFASEQKAFLAYPDYKLSVNTKSLFSYLTMGKIEDEQENFWKGIQELQPGNFLEYSIETNSLEITNYYQLTFNQELAAPFSVQKEKEYIQKVEELLVNSIRNHLKADVEVGACLSGGIDSSVIVGIVAEIFKKKGSQHTFSSVFSGHQAIDESSYAKLVAEKNKTIWNTVSPQAHEFTRDLKELCYTQDIPFISSSTYSQYRVMQLVSENGIKVTLDGQGADELFSGYISHYSSYFWELLSGLQLKSLAKNAFTTAHGLMQMTSPLKFMLAEEAPELFQNSFLKKKTAAKYLNESFIEHHKNQLNHYNKSWKASLNEQLFNEFTGTRLKHLMRTCDRNSMHFSVE